MASKLRIWTDGCCLSNPGGAGGWAFVAEVKGRVLDERSGYAAKSTNNQMELRAVIEALHYAHELPSPGPIQICSDSTYVVNGFSSWMPQWKADGWKRRGRGGTPSSAPIKNLSLWQEIEALARVSRGLSVSARWIKGHNGAEHNVRADLLAGAAARYLPQNVSEWKQLRASESQPQEAR